MTTKTSARKKTASPKGAAKQQTAGGSADGRADFAELLPEYKKLAKAQVFSPRLDVQAAITHVMGIVQRVQKPALRQQLLAMPDAQLPIFLDRLPKAARAARYAFLSLATTAASNQNAKVSLALFQEATELRTRMLNVCDYMLGDQPEHAAELRNIRRGKGYQDLADDLDRLAALYEKEAAAVQKDPKNYRAEDRGRALQVASAVLAEVADSNPTATADLKGGKVPAARDAANRAFALLALCYNEVAAAGRYLLRHEGGDEIFCSLYAAGRKQPRSSRPASTPQPSPAPV